MHKKMKSDQELLQLIHKDASRGIGLLMDRYSGLLYYIVRGKLNDRQQDIEECVSDVFIEFYSKMDDIDLQKGSIKAYLATIATRRAIDRVRKIMSHPEQDFEELEGVIGEETNEPEHVAMDSERNEYMLQEVKNLREPDSTILYRRYYLAQPVKEIAQDMGMKSNSVSKRITRALEVLQSRLEGYDYE